MPRKVFGSSRAPIKFTGKIDVIFSGPHFSCTLRNTRKLFRGYYGTIFRPEKFLGLLRNARLERCSEVLDGIVVYITLQEKSNKGLPSRYKQWVSDNN